MREFLLECLQLQRHARKDEATDEPALAVEKGSRHCCAEVHDHKRRLCIPQRSKNPQNPIGADSFGGNRDRERLPAEKFLCAVSGSAFSQ